MNSWRYGYSDVVMVFVNQYSDTKVKIVSMGRSGSSDHAKNFSAIQASVVMGKDDSAGPRVAGLVAWRSAYAEPSLLNSAVRRMPFCSAGVMGCWCRGFRVGVAYHDAEVEVDGATGWVCGGDNAGDFGAYVATLDDVGGETEGGGH